jgi:hypothetical protein
MKIIAVAILKSIILSKYISVHQKMSLSLCVIQATFGNDVTNSENIFLETFAYSGQRQVFRGTLPTII